MKKRSSLTLLLLLSIVGTMMITRSMASTTKLSVISVMDETYVPGSTIVIDITVTDVTDLYGFDIKLRYNPSILTATQANVGSFFPDFFIWKKVFAEDYVWFIVTRTLGAEGGLTGSGTIAMFHFTVNDLGLTYLDLFDTTLSDSFGIPIEHDVYDGYFSNIPTVFEADLVRHSAWPERHHYVISKDPDGYLTLNSLVKNLGTVPTCVKTNFTVYDSLGARLGSFETATVTLKSGEMALLTFDWNGYTADAKYSVEARCWYDSDGDGIIDAMGTKLKTFGFAVVP